MREAGGYISTMLSHLLYSERLQVIEDSDEGNSDRYVCC